MTRSLRLLFATAALALVPRLAKADPATVAPEQGYDLGDIPSPRAMGMGGAQVATGTSTNALYLNPANLPFAKVYHFEGLAAYSPEARRLSLGGAVADSATNKMAGGIGGMWTTQDADGVSRTTADFRASLAYPLGDRLSVGVTGRYLRVDQEIARGPFGSSSVSDGTAGASLVNLLTFDLGVTAMPVDGLKLAVTGRNLTNPGFGYAPTTITGAVGYGSETFTIEGDVLFDLTTWETTKPRVMLGAEYFAAEHYAIRAGYRFDGGTKNHALSLGVGYVDKRWSVEFSGRRDIAGEHPMTMMVLGLRYFYDTGGSVDGPDTM